MRLQLPHANTLKISTNGRPMVSCRLTLRHEPMNVVGKSRKSLHPQLGGQPVEYRAVE